MRKIEKTAIIDEGVILGDNIYIADYVHIMEKAIIGDNSEIRNFSVVEKGCMIGQHTKVYQFCNITSGAVVGDWVFVGAGTMIANDKEITYPCFDGDWKKQPPVICDRVRIGIAVVILPGIVLREGCVIGAGAVVTKSTEPYKIYVGVPAKEYGSTSEHR